jgi:hypothetical protein
MGLRGQGMFPFSENQLPLPEPFAVGSRLDDHLASIASGQ